MANFADLETVLRASLAEPWQKYAPALARLLAETAQGSLPDAEVENRLRAEPGVAFLLKELAGKTITGAGPLLSFGAGNQIGTVTVGDVAGGNILKISPTFLFQLTVAPSPTPELPDYRSASPRLVDDYQSVFGGRVAQLQNLHALLDQAAQPYALLLAPTGTGKTALLIHWVAQVQAAAVWTVVFVPISRRYHTASEGTALGRLARALASFHGQTLEGYNTSPDQLRLSAASYLRLTPPAGKKLLVVLDGLDEALGWAVDATLFPATLPPDVRVVASARTLANRTRNEWLSQLGWEPGQTVDLSLPPLGRDDLADILTRLGPPLDARGTDESFLNDMLHVTHGDPVTVRLLVEDLKAGKLSPEGLARLKPGLNSYVESLLADLEEHADREAVAHVTGPLCHRDGPARHSGPSRPGAGVFPAPGRFPRHGQGGEPPDPG